MATAPKKGGRCRRMTGHLVFQRTLRFWVYMDSGKADVILTDQLPAASVKEMQSRGPLSSNSANMNWQLAVNAPRARDPRVDGDAPMRSSQPVWRAGSLRRDAPAEDSGEEEGVEAAASSSFWRPTAPRWSPRRRT